MPVTRMPNTAHGRGVPVNPLPSWLRSAGVHEVVEVPNSRPATYLPALSGASSGIIAAWNGAYMRGTRYGMARNGGHADYGGNEVLEFDVVQEVPGWALMRARTPVEQWLGGSNYYDDGRPTSRHTYYATFWCAQLARVLSFCGWMGFAYNGSPVGGDADVWTTAVDAFDPEAGDWDLATHGNTTSSPGSETSTCMDLTTGDVYAWQGTTNRIWKWTAATRTCAQVADLSGTEGEGGALVFDSTNGRIVRVAGRFSALVSWDVDSSTKTARTATGPAASTINGLNNAQPGWGIAHDTRNNAVYLLALSGVLYRMRLGDFYVEEISTSGAPLVTPTNGAWGRLQYVEALHACVIAPTWASPMQIWRCQ